MSECEAGSSLTVNRLPQTHPVTYGVFASDEEETAYIADQLVLLGKVESQGVTSAAVLLRTSAQIRGVERALMERGVKYSIVGGYGALPAAAVPLSLSASLCARPAPGPGCLTTAR